MGFANHHITIVYLISRRIGLVRKNYFLRPIYLMFEVSNVLKIHC